MEALSSEEKLKIDKAIEDSTAMDECYFLVDKEDLVDSYLDYFITTLHLNDFISHNVMNKKLPYKAVQSTPLYNQEKVKERLEYLESLTEENLNKKEWSDRICEHYNVIIKHEEHLIDTYKEAFNYLSEIVKDLMSNTNNIKYKYILEKLLDIVKKDYEEQVNSSEEYIERCKEHLEEALTYDFNKVAMRFIKNEIDTYKNFSPKDEDEQNEEATVIVKLLNAVLARHPKMKKKK